MLRPLASASAHAIRPAWPQPILRQYACKLHQQQLSEGQDYLELKPTVSISSLDHLLFPDLLGHHLRFRMCEESRQALLSDDLDFHLLELPKFTKSASELATSLDNWLYILRHAEKIETEALPPALLQSPLARRAIEDLKMLAQTDIERERYEARRKAQLDHSTGLKAARLEGREEGREKGREEGRNLGVRIGVIHFCESLLNRPQTPTEQLAALSLAELDHLANQLQADVAKR